MTSNVVAGSSSQERSLTIHVPRQCLIEQCRSNWSVDMIARIFTQSFRSVSGFELETIPDTWWKYETLNVFAELSRYTAGTEDGTTVRHEVLVRLGHLWRAINLGMLNMVVGETWDEVEKALTEDMSAVIHDIKAVRNHGRTSVKRGHHQEKGENTTLEPQSGSKRHKTARQSKSNDSPVSMGNESTAAHVEFCENDYTSDVRCATSHVEIVRRDWDIGSGSLRQQLSKNVQIKRRKADTKSDQAAIKTLRDLSQIPSENCECGHMTCASEEEERGRCYLATGTALDIVFAYKKLGETHEVLEATAKNSRRHDLAVFLAKGHKHAEPNNSNGESTAPGPRRRLSLRSRFLTTWGQIPVDVIPDSMRTHFRDGEDPGTWNNEAMNQLEQIGREAGVIESATSLHAVRTYLERAYLNRIEDASNESRELTMRDTQSVLDEIQRQRFSEQSKSRGGPARGRDAKEPAPTRRSSGEPTTTGREQEPDHGAGPPPIEDALPEGNLEDQIIEVRDGLDEASERRNTLETEVVQAHAQRNRIALGRWHKDFDVSNADAQVALSDAQNRVEKVCQEIGVLERRLAALLRRR